MSTYQITFSYTHWASGYSYLSDTPKTILIDATTPQDAWCEAVKQYGYQYRNPNLINIKAI